MQESNSTSEEFNRIFSKNPDPEGERKSQGGQATAAADPNS